MKREPVVLQGGPADGQRLEVGTDWGAISWKPSTELEMITARTMGHSDPVFDPITYVRSRRSHRIFVYQP